MAGGMDIGISASGWESSIRAFKAMPADLKREVGRSSRHLAEPLAAELRSAGRAQGSHAAEAAAKIQSTSKGGVPAVRTSGLPYIHGSEFGGGIRRASYYSVSPRGTRYLITLRHTTAQFKTFRGRKGYWWTPTLESSRGKRAVLDAWSKVVDRVIAGW